ncbi:MAG: hypothetical protein D6685_12920 [Bacteroidetes bacterium]|nr:MAG: hypothetical protein D6685_12920 [Bacteroidota bacterium]
MRTRRQGIMRIHLVRHGPAEPVRAGQSDRERTLTSRGLRLVQDQAAALRRLSPEADLLLSSPYRRAMQTADRLAAALGCAVEPEAALQPDAEPQDLSAALRGRDDVEHVWAVGHQPLLGAWTYQATGAQVVIEPGTIVVVEASSWRPGRAWLAGVYALEWMAALGGSLAPPA